MIIVNTSYQRFENVDSCGELIVSTTTYNKNSFTHLRSQTLQKFLKKFSKIQDHKHTLLYEPAFIPKYFCNKLTKTPFGNHFFIILLNASFPDEVLKASLVEKTKYTGGSRGWHGGAHASLFFCNHLFFIRNHSEELQTV